LRSRVGDWRIAPGEIIVLAIAHRRQVYREET